MPRPRYTALCEGSITQKLLAGAVQPIRAIQRFDNRLCVDPPDFDTPIARTRDAVLHCARVLPPLLVQASSM